MHEKEGDGMPQQRILTRRYRTTPVTNQQQPNRRRCQKEGRCFFLCISVHFCALHLLVIRLFFLCISVHFCAPLNRHFFFCAVIKYFCAVIKIFLCSPRIFLCTCQIFCAPPKYFCAHVNHFRAENPCMKLCVPEL